MDRLTKKTARKQAGGICEASAGKISGFGKKMLEKQGWKEGEGLGVHGQGEVRHIKVKTKNDTVGLGLQDEDREYIARSLVEDPFKRAEVESITAPAAKQKKDDDDGWSSSSDEEDGEDEDDGNNGMDLAKMSEADRALFLLCGKRRLGRRAGRNQTGKWARELKSELQPAVVSTPSPAEQAQEEEEEEEEEKKDRKEKKKKKSKKSKKEESSDSEEEEEEDEEARRKRRRKEA